jgi:hypothetical protein
MCTLGVRCVSEKRTLFMVVRGDYFAKPACKKVSAKGTASAVPLTQCSLRGFSREGTLFKSSRAKSTVFCSLRAHPKVHRHEPREKNVPQGLEPSSAQVFCGTTEAVPIVQRLFLRLLRRR